MTICLGRVNTPCEFGRRGAFGKDNKTNQQEDREGPFIQPNFMDDLHTGNKTMFNSKCIVQATVCIKKNISLLQETCLISELLLFNIKCKDIPHEQLKSFRNGSIWQGYG